jgi:hypothetical protein
MNKKWNSYLNTPERSFEILDSFLQNSNVKIEYVKDFDLSLIKRKMMSDTAKVDFDQILNEKYIDDIEYQIKKIDEGLDPEELPTLSKFYERRYFIKDALTNGILHPLNVEVYKTVVVNSKTIQDVNNKRVVFLVHPGQKRLHISQLLNWKFIPFFIFSSKSENINFGGVEIKSSVDFINLEVYKWWEKENIHWTIRSNCDMWSDYPGIDNTIMGTTHKPHIGNTGYSTEYDRGEYVRNVHNFEDKKKYLDLVKNSLPLNIYGNNINIDKIKKSSYLVSNTDGDDVRCVFKSIFKNDIYNIPRINNFKGMAVYVDSKLDWESNRSIFELFYFGKVEKVMCKSSDGGMILFNCEHPFWKTDNDISKLKNQEIGFLPDYS